MKANKPVGFAALLAKMPKGFKARAKRVEERARRFAEMPAAPPAEAKEKAHEEWQDTVAHFINLK